MILPIVPYQVDYDLSALGVFLKRNGIKRILLLTGKTSYHDSGAAATLGDLLNDYQVIRFDEFQSNPNIDDLITGVNVFNEFSPDVLIAVGGGSVIDAGKLIPILSTNLSLNMQILTSNSGIGERKCKFVAIPTTSGSGSESTHFAVIYVNNRKYSVSDDSLLPDYVILDHKLTHSQSPYLTAVAGMDALSQAVESFWALGATSSSLKFAEVAISIILDVFPRVVSFPDHFSRQQMLFGAHYAGRAINITKTTAPHAISYYLTSNYGLAHGHAVALTLPQLFEYNLIDPSESWQVADMIEYKKRIPSLLKLIKCQSVSEGRLKLERIIQKAGLETKLRNLGVSSKKELQVIAENVNVDRLRNNPRPVSIEDVLKFLNALW